MPGGGVGQVRDAREALLDGLDLAPGPGSQVHALVHGLPGGIQVLPDGLQQGGDLLGLPGGPVGELAHLLRHHGKAPARGPGVGRLDGRVEAEHPGAIGDLPDHHGDLVHLENVPHEGLQPFGRDLRLLLELADRRHGLVALPPPLVGQVGHEPGGFGSFLRRRGGLGDVAPEPFQGGPDVLGAGQDLVDLAGQGLHPDGGPRRPGRRTTDDFLQAHEVLDELV